MHSSDYQSGEGWGGKKAIVVGSCNSGMTCTDPIATPFLVIDKFAYLGHDIAQDLHDCGADVTMVQRSSTLVISSEKGVPILLSRAYSEDSPATEVRR